MNATAGVPVFTTDSDDYVDHLCNQVYWLSSLMKDGISVVSGFEFSTKIGSVSTIDIENKDKNFGAQSLFAWDIRKELLPLFINLWGTDKLQTSIEPITHRIHKKKVKMFSHQPKEYMGNMASVSAYVAFDEYSSVFYIPGTNKGRRVNSFSKPVRLLVRSGEIVLLDNRLSHNIQSSNVEEGAFGMMVTMQPFVNISERNKYRKGIVDAIKKNKCSGNDSHQNLVRYYKQDDIQSAILASKMSEDLLLQYKDLLNY